MQNVTRITDIDGHVVKLHQDAATREDGATLIAVSIVCALCGKTAQASITMEAPIDPTCDDLAMFAGCARNLAYSKLGRLKCERGDL